MKLTIDVKGLDEVRSVLQGFSDRRVMAAGVTALTRTAGEIRDAVQKEMLRAFDRPTPYTLRSVRVDAATAGKQVASVYISQQKAPRDPSPAVVLKPQVEGGPRGTKGLEHALRRMGALPQGWLVVPSRSLPLDAYGNVSRGVVQQVIAQLRQQVDVGPRNARAIVKAVRKAGSRFFVVKPGGRTEPGVYSADVVGRNITPVFIFINGAAYRQKLDFYGVAERIARLRFPAQLGKAISESAARLGAR